VSLSKTDHFKGTIQKVTEMWSLKTMIKIDKNVNKNC